MRADDLVCRTVRWSQGLRLQLVGVLIGMVSGECCPPNGTLTGMSVRVICGNDLQPVYLVLQRCSLKAEALRSSVFSGYSPGCRFQRIDNYLPFGVFE